MKTTIAVLACAVAASAAAQEQPKSETPAPRPALNLRLDDASSAAPRVDFAPPAASQTKDQREKGLPEMGGKPNQAFNRPVAPDGVNSSSPNNSVIPSAMDPAVNRQ